MPPELAQDLAAIQARKRQHLELAVADRSQHGVSAGWDDVHLIPAALPAGSIDDVDLATELFGRRLQAPIVLAGMTGGHDGAADLNAVLGAAAERLGLAVGVGSQRAALADPRSARSFAAVRDRAPNALVIGNVGMCQLVPQGTRPGLSGSEITALVDMVGADALAVHLNVVQEIVQTEGDRNFGRLAEAIGSLVSSAPVPVLAKETGAGFSRSSAAALIGVGVAAIDTGGAGGTSFARIEGGRAEAAGDRRGARLGALFADWGVPAAASLLELASLPEVRRQKAPVAVIATGGIRSGLDAAKALSLGATAVGLGRPAMLAAQRGEAALVEMLEDLIDELRVALVLTGSTRPIDLGPPVLTGFTLEWARQRSLLSGGA